MKRPVIWYSLSFMAGIYCYHYAAKQLLFCGVFLALLSLCLYFVKKTPLCFLIFAFFLCGAAGIRHWQAVTLEQPALVHNQKVSFEGRVSDLPKENSNGAFCYRISLSSLNGKKSRATLWLTSQQELSAGERITATGNVSSSLVMQRQGDGFGDYLVRQGYSLTCSNPEITSLPPTFWSKLASFPFTLRQQMISTLNQNLSAPWRGILVAITTGDRSGLTSVQNDIFVATGTSHIISVSGLHVSILLSIAMTLLSFLRVPYPINRYLCLPLPLFLAVFMGWQAPVLRACIMGFLLILAECVWTEADPMNSLFLSAFLILLVRPDQLFQASFLLSFGATFGILAFSPVLEQLANKKIPSKELCSVTSVSVSSYLTTMLTVLYFYHQLPSISFAANLLLTPLFPILMAGTFLYALAAAVFPALCAPGAALLESLTALIFRPLEWMAGAPTIQLAAPNQYWIAAYCFLIVFFYFISRKYKGGVLFLCFTLCLGAGCVQQYQLTKYHSVTAVSAGCIDNVILQSSRGNTMLIAGVTKTDTSFSYDYRELLNYFRKNNIQTIDVFCFLNYNKDTAALFRALGQDRNIQTVLLPDSTGFDSELKRIAQQNNTAVTRFSQPVSIPLSDTCRCIASPDGIFLFYDEETLAAEISPRPKGNALLSKQPGRKEVKAEGQPYSEQQYGTLRFLLQHGAVHKIISETTYE